MWFIGNILWFIAPVLGSYFTLFTGLGMLLVNLLWASIVETCNGRIGRIQIPFDAGFLTLNYSWGFYINLIAGLIATVGGIVLIIIGTKERAFNEEKTRQDMERELKADRKSKKSNKDETDDKPIKSGKAEVNEIEMNAVKPTKPNPPARSSVGGGAGIGPSNSNNGGFGGYQYAQPNQPTNNATPQYPYPNQNAYGNQPAPPVVAHSHSSSNENQSGYAVDPNQNGYPQQSQPQPYVAQAQPPQFVPPVRMPGAMPMHSIMRRPNVGPGE